jgi:UDP-N-acetyl-D-mannosaminuronic acid dehydrogenase
MNPVRACVVGLGYIGMPTAARLAAVGHAVVGVDLNQRILDALANGHATIDEPDLAQLVGEAVASGHLVGSARPVPADVFIIAVPTPLRGLARKGADLAAVRAASRSIATVLRPGNLVVLESTSPPGTTTRVVAPILERASGLKAGKDFFLAHCPERVLPGRILHELVNNDRVVGGIDPGSTEAARKFYATFVDGAILLTDATTAELVKLMENTFRDVNIALANEFALVAEKLGVDVWEAIEAANHHPRVNFLRPGPGVGGHCIAVDPWFIVGAAPEITPLIVASRAVNDVMPMHVVDLISESLGGVAGRRIVVLGATYKANVEDTRESPAVRVAVLLREEGAEVMVHDAMVAAAPSVEDLAENAEYLVLLVDHAAYRKLDPVAIGRRMRRANLLDTRNFLSAETWREAGFRVARLGDGRSLAADADAAEPPG